MYKKILPALMIIILFTFLHCSKKDPVSSENVNASFQLQGTVSDNGADFLGNGAEPVANALVTITDQTDTNRTFSSYTDEQGHYLIEIPQTSALLKASHITGQESGTQVSSRYSLTITGDNIASYVEHDIDIPVTRTLDVSVTRIVIDIDGNEYQTVKIGDQWWTSQNLKTTRYRNGDPIPYITDNSEPVEYVEFFIDDVSRIIDTDEPYEWVLDENLFGRHTIKAIAFDSEGGYVEDTIDATFFIFG